MMKNFHKLANKVDPSLFFQGARAFGSYSPSLYPELAKDSKRSNYDMKFEWDYYGSHSHHPIPLVLSHGKGVDVWDIDGNKYLDFFSACSAVNQGHCHPKILQAMMDQAQKTTLRSRAFYNDQLGSWEKYITEAFGYDKALFMNTGVEGGETAMKLARRWIYQVKKIAPHSAKILFAAENFWGRTLATSACSDDPSHYHNFGPFYLSYQLVKYGDINAFEEALKADPNIAAYVIEPIQGEAGVIIPPEGYLKKVKQLCEKHKVLLICDEVQTGLGRTGKLLASDWEDVKPDLLVLGKALSGGMYPVSAVLAQGEATTTMRFRDHSSTYADNLLGSAIGKAALQALIEEDMAENSRKMGEKLLAGIQDMKKDFIKSVRGRGLFIALEVEGGQEKVRAWDMCLKLKDKGLLAEPTHDHTIRFSPPLVINEEQINRSLEVITDVMKSF